MSSNRRRPKPLPRRPKQRTKQVATNTKKINTLLKNIEYKFFEVTTNVSPANDQIIEDSLVKIAQGDTGITRDGRKIVVTGIHFRGHIKMDAGGSGAGLRLVLYHDKQPNGATASTTDYFSSANALTNSFRNLNTIKRFKVLHDKTYILNQTSATVSQILRHVVINLKVNIPIVYTSTTGAITELLESNIGLLSSANNQTLDLDGIWRIRYMDL